MANPYLWEAPTSNAFQTTLNGTIDDAVVTITLTSITGLVAPGVLVIDRQDGIGNDTPTKREYISFTGISGSDLTGVSRELGGSTAQSHSSGALVEGIASITHWNDMVDFAQVEHDSAGKHVISTATISYTETKRLVCTSLASIARVSSDNYVGMKGQFVWTRMGALATSLATAVGDTHIAPLRASKNLTLNSVFLSLNSAPSLAALSINIDYKATPTTAPISIFSTKPTIDIGEYTTATAATPAVLTLTSLASGTLLSPSIEAPGNSGDLMISLIATER